MNEARIKLLLDGISFALLLIAAMVYSSAAGANLAVTVGLLLPAIWVSSRLEKLERMEDDDE